MYILNQNLKGWLGFLTQVYYFICIYFSLFFLNLFFEHVRRKTASLLWTLWDINFKRVLFLRVFIKANYLLDVSFKQTFSIFRRSGSTNGCKWTDWLFRHLSREDNWELWDRLFVRICLFGVLINQTFNMNRRSASTNGCKRSDGLLLELFFEKIIGNC